LTEQQSYLKRINNISFFYNFILLVYLWLTSCDQLSSDNFQSLLGYNAFCRCNLSTLIILCEQCCMKNISFIVPHRLIIWRINVYLFFLGTDILVRFQPRLWLIFYPSYLKFPLCIFINEVKIKCVVASFWYLTCTKVKSPEINRSNVSEYEMTESGTFVLNHFVQLNTNLSWFKDPTNYT
jgi:hypothetical protein